MNVALTIPEANEPHPSLLAPPAVRLFLLSFVALFLELMVIRWVPSEVRLVAYYANLMLVSSFLGLGIGAILTARGWRLFRWFPLLLATHLGFLVLAGYVALPVGGGEMRFYQLTETKVYAYAVLTIVFLLNAIVFVPLGEEIGAQFQRLPSLRAYGWDLLGSLGGTVAFGLFSFLHFAPLAGFFIVVAAAWLLGARTARWRSLVAYAVTLLTIAWSTTREPTWWSPYYFITIRENQLKIDAQPGRPATGSLVAVPAQPPPANLLTMKDPPLYTVRVNQDFYQMHGTIDLRRYAPGADRTRLLEATFAAYELPYRVVPPPKTVLVLGAGGGMDVETALLHGAQRVDAVEIDPVIAQLSNRYSAARPYADPRVFIHIDDARAFLQRDSARYDLVAFGHLDSQALFSYGASLRLDGYTYTVEGFRAAFARVADHGSLVVSFIAGREWMAQKLVQMVAAATATEPIVYLQGGHIVIIAPKRPPPTPAEKLGEWTRVRAAPSAVDLATDDWPYLYLAQRAVPTDYAIIIGLLLVLSVGALLALRGRTLGPGDGHFLFLGWGFLLLQTKGISDCSLYFGTTWLVTTLVIAGVLLMVLLANAVALRFVRSFHLALYLPLFLSLLLLIAVPREWVLAQDLVARGLWTVLVVPLPVFFAGLIFSTTFRASPAPALSLGANLIGATIGGFCEYLGMWIGSTALSYMVLAAYAASLLCQLRHPASGPAQGAPASPPANASRIESA